MILSFLVLPDCAFYDTVRKTLRATTGFPVIGTPGFMCPRYMRSGLFEEKSEVYAIGVTLLQHPGFTWSKEV